MKVSTFIERPVLSAVISITIMVAGIIGLFTLPVAVSYTHLRAHET